MNEIKNGGPAFPVECDWVEGQPQGRQTATQAGWHEGMSLRDWFAAKAMQAFLSRGIDNEELTEQEYDAMIAAWSYDTADAMLKARGAA